MNDVLLWRLSTLALQREGTIGLVFLEVNNGQTGDTEMGGVSIWRIV